MKLLVQFRKSMDLTSLVSAVVINRRSPYAVNLVLPLPFLQHWLGLLGSALDHSPNFREFADWAWAKLTGPDGGTILSVRRMLEKIQQEPAADQGQRHPHRQKSPLGSRHSTSLTFAGIGTFSRNPTN